MIKATHKIICVLFLLFPLTVWGQQSGHWGNGKLRASVVNLSSEIPYALAAYDFAERYLTELQALPAAEQKSRMERDDVQFLLGGLNNLRLINEETSMSFSEKDNRYMVMLSNGMTPVFELSFPASCQLLTGKNLKELERELVADLTGYQYTPSAATPVAPQELKKLTGDYYIKTGEVYSMEEINNHLYYEDKKGKKQLVFHVDHPAESVFNLLLAEETPCDAFLHLTIRQYGMKKDQLALPLRWWIAYMKSRGCTLYAGIEALETNQVKAYVFAVNTVLKYNHVMSVEIPYTLLNEGKGEIKGDITLFVPTHNISSLFEELNWVNTTPKRQIKIQ